MRRLIKRYNLLRHCLALIWTVPFVCLSFIAPMSAAKGDDASALAQLMGHLSQFDQLHLRYEQMTLDGSDESASGEFLLKRPGQFKLLPDDDGAVVVSDGTTLWTQDDLLAQVTAQPVAMLQSFSPARVLLMRQAEMAANFHVHIVGSDGFAFMLTPKNQLELVRSVILEFDTLAPTRVTMVSSTDQKIVVDLKVISVNQMISNDQFEVEIADGVDFVDYR